MLSYVIVGSGYRAIYFGRIAIQYPTLFRALFLCRSSEKAQLIETQTGVRATTSLDECLAFQPDFAVIAVDRGHVADVAEEWISRGFPVVTETPVGDTPKKLNRLWELSQQGARIVCCEQYHRYPILMAGLDILQRGGIGAPSSLYISLAHDYHAASLIRRMLQTDGEAFTLRGMRLTSPVVNTDSRYGAILDGSVSSAERTMLTISYESGKTAIYDFSPIEYRSYIRSRHVTVRGDRGEWSDTIVFGLDEDNRPRRTFLMPEIPARYARLDTQYLRDLRKTWHAELFLDTQEDEFAIASILLDMEEYLAGGPSPYPLQEALDDVLFWLLAEKAAQSPWETFDSRGCAWRA